MLNYTLEDLFDQLGLAEDHDSIEQFVQAHSPLQQSTPLYKADFWTASQALFLEEAIAEDSTWAIVVDQLDVLLRS